MPVEPTGVFVAVTLLGALLFAWAYAGRGRWHAAARRRWLYGVPWGSALTIAIVLAFYLFVQRGLWHWETPVVYPFVSWSYHYPFGMLTAGIAHGSAPHIVSNLSGTLVLAPIAEYAWGHYPGGSRELDEDGGDGSGDGLDADSSDVDGADDEAQDEEPDDWRDAEWADDELLPDGGAGSTNGGVLASPWGRAFVLFPGALLLAAVLTSVFSLGPGIGFSGAVYAIAGFALIRYPMTTLVGVVAFRSIPGVYQAITEPVVEGTLESSAPSFPAWVGIGFQTHALGFLLGVLAALALVGARSERPAADRIFLAVFVFGMVQALWLIAFPESTEVYNLYRGVGVVAVVLLSVIVTVAASANDYHVPTPFGPASTLPSARALSMGWLGLLTSVLLFGVLGAAVAGPVVLLFLVPLLALSALPAIPALLPSHWNGTPLRVHHLGIGALLAGTILVAAIGPFSGMVAVTDAQAPGDASVDVEGYSVGYAENATIARESTLDLGGNETEPQRLSAVFVVNQDREIFTPAVRAEVLAFSGTETVVIGGPGWHDTVEANRTGWEVAGNDTVYAVDLTHDGETVRSYTANASTAESRLADHRVAVVSVAESFNLRVSDDAGVVDTVPIPATGQETDVGDITLRTEERDDARHVYMVEDGARALVATEETY